jgi:hypothetical protein
MDTIHLPVFYLKPSVSDTGLCFRFQAEPSHFGLTELVQTCDSLINVPSLQTYVLFISLKLLIRFRNNISDIYQMCCILCLKFV